MKKLLIGGAIIGGIILIIVLIRKSKESKASAVITSPEKQEAPITGSSVVDTNGNEVITLSIIEQPQTFQAARA